MEAPMSYPDDFRADHPASPYSTAAAPDGNTPAERFADVALRLESLCGLLDEVWDQQHHIAAGCGGVELVGEIVTTLEAALAPMRGRIEAFVTVCGINDRIDDIQNDAIIQRGVAALNAIIKGRAA
jgi:hypothetical protein